MQKRILTLTAALLAITASASAQAYTSDYVTWPESSELPTYIKQWNEGTLNFEDMNFFISRVKPKTRFRNAATQIDKTLNATNDKRLVDWVPIGDMNSDGGCNALPNGVFDSEVFSMWSYVSHFGDWTSPYGWVPGSLADVAHKNGVGVSGVASIPFGGISTSWANSLAAMAQLDPTTVAKFLHYNGSDGLGYNSEYTGSASATQTIADKIHPEIIRYLTEQGNPVAENMWYDGTNYSGSCSFDRGLGSHNLPIFGGDKQRRASLFFNYNWGRYGNLAGSVTTAQNNGLDPLYIYAGFNQQGNDPGSNNWEYLKQNNVSVGLWGAHANNMFWAGRNAGGSNPKAMQRTYLNTIERFFGNGPQNPAIQLPVVNGACNQGVPSFFGMSALMTAKSTLSWDLGEEPFITYFNIGNGQYFNWKGVRTNDRDWYNIGVQDYLPTWRYWWAPSFLGTGVKEGDVKLNATFTWDDAYVGGSCLQITGTQADAAYLHLFKTKFELNRGDVISLTYKLNRGTAKVTMVFSTEGDEATAIENEELVILDATATPDDEAWVTKELELTRGSVLAEKLANKTLAMIALKVEGAADLDLNIGKISIVREEAATPATPKVTLAKVLKNHYKGIDAKLIWDMPNNKPAGTPVYNSDVNTSLFKLYFQEEGSEPVLTGITTSWAGLFYSAPVATADARVRFGVAAVSMDHNSDSEIAWSEWQNRGDYTSIDDIQVNKTTLKPNEGFTVSYVDSKHAPANWTIYNADGVKMSEAKQTTEINVPDGYKEIGGYDVVLNEGTANERRYGYFIQISSPETGAWPEIYSISVNGEEVTEESAEEVTLEPAQSVELAYTGRDADGAGSRGLFLNEHPFGVRVGDLGIEDGTNFSVAGWIKLSSLPDGVSSFMTVENRGGSWPANNWGFFWARITDQGKFKADGRIDTCWGMRLDASPDGMRMFNQYDDAKIGLDAWTHFAVVFEFQGKSRRVSFYLNGVKQTMSAWIHVNKATFESRGNWSDLTTGFSFAQAHGANCTESGYASYSFGLTANDWISFGGTGHEMKAVNGTIDDFQVWNTAMTDADVKASMSGLDPNNLPAGVVAYWDFESDPAADLGFPALGSKEGAKAYLYEFASGDNEGQAGKVYAAPAYEVGCPFIAGSSYKVETLPTWTAKKATVTKAEGNTTAGKATMTWAAEGDYNVTLTLANSHGSDSRTFPVFHVTTETGITDVTADGASAQAYAVDGTLMVEVAGNDAYTVTVADTAGRLVATRSVAAGAERMMRIDLRSTGVYVVNVTTDGGATRTFKLMSK